MMRMARVERASIGSQSRDHTARIHPRKFGVGASRTPVTRSSIGASPVELLLQSMNGEGGRFRSADFRHPEPGSYPARSRPPGMVGEVGVEPTRYHAPEACAYAA